MSVQDAENLMMFSKTMSQRLQQDLGHLISATRNAVSRLSPGWDRTTQNDAQERLDHIVGGLSVLYLLAIAEELGVTRTTWRDGLDASDYEFVLATYHVRHSIAHRDAFGRASTYRQEFDNVMASPRKFPCVKQHSAMEIRLGSSVGVYLQNELSNLAQTAASRLSRV